MKSNSSCFRSLLIFLTIAVLNFRRIFFSNASPERFFNSNSTLSVSTKLSPVLQNLFSRKECSNLSKVLISHKPQIIDNPIKSSVARNKRHQFSNISTPPGTNIKTITEPRLDASKFHVSGTTATAIKRTSEQQIFDLLNLRRRRKITTTALPNSLARRTEVRSGITTPGQRSLDFPVSQDNLNSIEDLRKIFGENANPIYDDKGNFVGIAPWYSDATSNEPGWHATSDTGGPRRTSALIPPNGININYGDLSSIQAVDFTEVCCSTREMFYVNTTLTDVSGQTRTIAQKGQIGSYQLIRHGLCGYTGRCAGECVQQYATMHLMTYPSANNKLPSFSFFYIPGYCTCKVRSNQLR